MLEKEFEIKNPTGLHLRPAGMLCDVAQKYDSHIYFTY
ncbi:MAG: HPr family phosphocarrier protein, partial [Lachnospiraceae bacterium]|nr:HPr family phosphocarrier protein [Lachnospiraceae bacterium]